jgi:hypothetical protein
MEYTITGSLQLARRSAHNNGRVCPCACPCSCPFASSVKSNWTDCDEICYECYAIGGDLKLYVLVCYNQY